jgi:hypothetical protein
MMPVRDVAVAVSSPLRARDDNCERHSQQAFAGQTFGYQAFNYQVFGFQIPADQTIAR